EFSSDAVRQWFDQPFFLGNLPLQVGILPFLGFDLLILMVLIYVTGRLRQSDAALAEPPVAPFTSPAAPTTSIPPLPIGGAAPCCLPLLKLPGASPLSQASPSRRHNRYAR